MEAVAEQRQFAPGTMLDSKYRIDHLLAVGGMGAVYIGTHTKLRKRVAIKVLNPQLSSPLMVERFHREAVTASQIGHEGIAQVTDLGTSREGEPFLVMELLEGESLAKRIKTVGAMPIGVACRIAAAILSPLEAAHRAGIVHRDLKPDNVFLVRQSRGEMVKLLDFGIARAAGLESEFRLTTTGLVLGTPYYMSPEQARGESEVTHLADIYAVGVILYEMVCGQVPIHGENYNQLMFKVMSGDYRPPRDLRADLPRDLERIILASMALEPQARPRTASALEQALVPFCGPAFSAKPLDRSPPAVYPMATPSAAATVANNANRPAPEASTKRRRLAIAGVASLCLIGGIIAIASTSSTRIPTLPAEAKPTEAKPAEARPTEAKPAEPKPAEAKPAEAKPAEAKPAEAVQAQVKPADVQPPSNPTETRPAETSPIGAAPAETGSSPIPPGTSPTTKPATIKLRFSVVPPSARVFVDGRRVNTDELEVAKDDELHKIRITAPGYLTHDEVVKFDETQKLAIELSKASRGTQQIQPPTDRRGSGKIESRSPYE